MMYIRVGQSRFEALEDGQVVGWLDFQVTAEGVALTHTIVPERHAGQGVGTALVAWAMEHAVENEWKVLPYCSFVRAYLVDHPQYRSLVPEDRRAEFGM